MNESDDRRITFSNNESMIRPREFEHCLPMRDSPVLCIGIEKGSGDGAAVRAAPHRRLDGRDLGSLHGRCWPDQRRLVAHHGVSLGHRRRVILFFTAAYRHWKESAVAWAGSGAHALERSRCLYRLIEKHCDRHRANPARTYRAPIASTTRLRLRLPNEYRLLYTAERGRAGQDRSQKHVRLRATGSPWGRSDLNLRGQPRRPGFEPRAPSRTTDGSRCRTPRPKSVDRTRRRPAGRRGPRRTTPCPCRGTPSSWSIR